MYSHPPDPGPTLSACDSDRSDPFMEMVPTPPARGAGSAADGAVARADRMALDADFADLYEELRVIARRHLWRNRSAHTLGTTGLVHESYLKLADLGGARWRSRVQFFALASKAMRHILVDHARTRAAQKRGGNAIHVTLHPEMAAGHESVDLLSLNEALAKLGQQSERLERVVECKFFGGLTTEETAEALATSVRTVERDWTRAKAYLFQMLSSAANSGAAME
jgi:RNA polymerase sigma factor (TIGR02999 family)